jgi:Type II CAAX prenyl endopeptidase Rce1-like
VFKTVFAMFNPSEFIQFLKKPQYHFIERKETPVICTAIKIYFLSLLFIGLVNSLNITVLKTIFTLPIDASLAVPEPFKNHLWIYFLFVVIYSPIMEEVIFRLPLIFDPVNISLSISTLLALIVHKVSDGIFPIITFLLLFFLIMRLVIIYEFNLFSFWGKNFRYIFYLLCLTFGLVHISNYKFIEISQYFIAPFLVLPQLLLGFLLSYTRLYYKKGFLICIFIHSLMNLISTSVFLFEYSYHISG